MKIEEMATTYFALIEDLEALEIDMFANEEEKKEKREKLKQVRN